MLGISLAGAILGFFWGLLGELDWFYSLPYSNCVYVIYQHTTIVIVVVVAFTFAFFSPSPNPVVQGFSELEFGVLES